jgi:hypothetical protein
VYFSAAAQAHRESIKTGKCPTCLSPCQMNVSAVKQVVPYVKFLYRASREKRRKPAMRPGVAATASVGRPTVS